MNYFKERDEDFIEQIRRPIMEDKELNNLIKIYKGLEQLMLHQHQYHLGKLPHIKQYRNIRKLHQTLGQKMIDFYHDHPELQEEMIEKLNKEQCSLFYKLGRLNLYDDLDNHYFIDMILYPNELVYDMSTYYLDHHKVRSERNKAFVKAMQESYISIFKILDKDCKEGKVRVKDLIDGKEFEMIDEGLSFSKLIDKYYLWRIIEFEGIYFQSGFTMMYDHDELKKWLRKHRNQKLNVYDIYLLYEKYKKGENINRIHQI